MNPVGTGTGKYGKRRLFTAKQNHASLVPLLGLMKYEDVYGDDAGNNIYVLIDFSITVKAATLIFISGRGSAISFAKEGKSGFIHNWVKS